MNIRSTASIQIQGPLKASDLAGFLDDIPDDAAISITETKGDQRDPGYSTITASWTKAAR
jgi:hypothetical protein